MVESAVGIREVDDREESAASPFIPIAIPTTNPDPELDPTPDREAGPTQPLDHVRRTG